MGGFLTRALVGGVAPKGDTTAAPPAGFGYDGPLGAKLFHTVEEGDYIHVYDLQESIQTFT